MNEHLLREVAARGKYAPLFLHLAALDGPRWRAAFRDVEAILGFSLPNSARIHRPWSPARKRGLRRWQYRLPCKDMRRFATAFEVLEDSQAVTDLLATLCRDVGVAGKQVHDANIVATMLTHGERRLATFNAKDFRRYGQRVQVVALE